MRRVLNDRHALRHDGFEPFRGKRTPRIGKRDRVGHVPAEARRRALGPVGALAFFEGALPAKVRGPRLPWALGA